jgi:hypothetical protein
MKRVGYVWCVCPVTRENRPLQGHYHEVRIGRAIWVRLLRWGWLQTNQWY